MTTSFVERLQVHQSRQSDLLAYLNQVLESSPTRRPVMNFSLPACLCEVPSSIELAIPEYM